MYKLIHGKTDRDFKSLSDALRIFNKTNGKAYIYRITGNGNLLPVKVKGEGFMHTVEKHYLAKQLGYTVIEEIKG